MMTMAGAGRIMTHCDLPQSGHAGHHSALRLPWVTRSKVSVCGVSMSGPSVVLPVDQPVQQVQNMRLGRYASIQGQFHRPNDNLFVVMKNERKNIDHLTITTGAAEHLVLQFPKGRRQFQERCTIAQGTGLALDDGKIVPPVVNSPWWFVVAALYDPRMFAEDIALGCNDQPARDKSAG